MPSIKKLNNLRPRPTYKKDTNKIKDGYSLVSI